MSNGSENEIIEYTYINEEKSNFGNVGYWNEIIRLDAIDNPEYAYTILDSSDKVLFGITKDGTTYIPKGISEDTKDRLESIDEVIPELESNPEYTYTILDNNGRLLFGITKDGTTYIPKGISEDAKDEILRIESLVNSEISRLDTEIETINETLPDIIDNPEYAYAILDSSDRVLLGIDKSGTTELPKQHLLDKYDDIENRVTMTLDSNDRILNYRKADGTLVETKMEVEDLKVDSLEFDKVSYTSDFITQLESDLRSSGFTSGTGDWTNSDYLYLPIPSTTGKVNIIYDGDLPTSKTVEYKGYLEYWDMSGNYFKKPITFSAQGSSSMGYVKKNMSIDFDDCDIKFDSWVAQDSFHFKAYYIDATRGKCIVGYRLGEQFYQTREPGYQRPWDYLSTPNIDAYGSTGDLDKDFETGALGHPDGFPVMLYHNGDFHGIYTWNLKKNKDNYHVSKNDPTNIILDGSISNTTLWTGDPDTIGWTSFEVRYPKDILDMEGNEYDGDYPTEPSDTDDLSSTAKINIERLGSSLVNIEAADDSKTEFAKYYLVDFFIDYFIQAQVIYNFDGFAKNWIWCTWDGALWTPTYYDQDSIFGQYWKGSYIRESSFTAILGTSTSLPSGLLWKYYADEVKSRYSELRDLGIISVRNIVDLQKSWMDQIGYDNYDTEFERWPETPSYRESYVNSEYWKIGEALETLGNTYSPDISYSVGDTCYYGKTGSFLCTCIKECTGEVPITQFHTSYPYEVGYYESLTRISKWLDLRITYLDTYFEYTTN